MMATPADATADQLLGYGLWFMVSVIFSTS